LKKISLVGNCRFLFTGKFCQKVKFKILKKFLDEMVFGEVFNCPKDGKLKTENCHVSMFGFRSMMIKDLHVTLSKSSYR